MHWFELQNIDTADSPSLLIYKERVQGNIAKMIDLANSPDWLFVHVKTNKMPKVVQMMLDAGISKFKCATIAEAEMVCLAGGRFMIVAHQLVGPKIERLVQLRQQYPEAMIASLVDNEATAQQTNAIFAQHNLTAQVFLDVNNGMDRSGHPVDARIFGLYQWLNQQSNLHCYGLHVYDGHQRSPDFEERKQKLDAGFEGVNDLLKQIKNAGLPNPMVVAGGTPAFTTHLLRVNEVNNLCYSPGTCVLWDWGYGDALVEQPFEYAAIVLTRIISKPAPGLISIDMGHKAVAAENPINKRIRFLNLTDYELLSQSEEHGVVRVSNWDSLNVGDVLYGVPYHVCPTVNLYDEAYCVSNNTITDTWQVLGRKRRISI